jgi:hypothetical protein
MDTVGINKRVRNYLIKYPTFFRLAKESMIAINLARTYTRYFIRKILYSAESLTPFQSPQTFSNRGFPPFSSSDELAVIFKKRSLHVDQGLHTLYLPPQLGLKDALGEIVEWYPENSGFKVLKHFAKLENARYINIGTTSLISVLMGGIENQAFAASCLYALGLAPKLYDVAQLTLGKVDLTIMIVEHCQGHSPSLNDGDKFIKLLKELKSQGFFQLANPSGLDCQDFTPPECNGNLLMTPDNRFCYIDPQQFLFDKYKVLNAVLEQAESHLHFGNTSRLIQGGGKFLYQAIPGLNRASKRETEYRWSIIFGLIEKHAINLSGKVIFDVCCNAGMITSLCLANGGMWGMGWDLPEVAAAAEKILAVQGLTRFQAVGCELSESYDLTADIPGWLRKHTAGAVLFFLAAWRHVGFPRSIAEIEWEWLFYEGHGNDDKACTQENIERIKRDWKCIDLETVLYRDGIGTSRPLVVFKRTST